MKRLMKLLITAVIALGAATGCNDRTGERPSASQPKLVKQASQVVVPDSVKGKWKAVKVAVSYKRANRQQVYTIGIGSELKLPDSSLTLKVENFLPHFVMDGTTFTSQSNELTNPAAQLSVKEGGREIFNGWLFALYPTTHAFQHPQYGFTLVDYISAG